MSPSCSQDISNSRLVSSVVRQLCGYKDYWCWVKAEPRASYLCHLVGWSSRVLYFQYYGSTFVFMVQTMLKLVVNWHELTTMDVPVWSFLWYLSSTLPTSQHWQIDACISLGYVWVKSYRSLETRPNSSIKNGDLSVQEFIWRFSSGITNSSVISGVARTLSHPLARSMLSLCHSNSRNPHLLLRSVVMHITSPSNVGLISNSGLLLSLKR